MLYIDIDGVLNDYPFGWLKYLNINTKKHFSYLTDAKMNISYTNYIKLRDTYRLKIEPNLSGNIHVIRSVNIHCPYSRILVTKRPVYAITHLENTFSFLRTNKVHYEDIIYWNKDLRDPNIPFQVPNCLAGIEDNFKIANFLVETFSMRMFVLINQNNIDYMDTAIKGVSSGDQFELQKWMKELI